MKSASHALKPLSIKLTLPDESEDEIYNELKEIQMKQKKDARDRLKVLKSINKDIKSSTPTQAQKGRKKVNPVKQSLFLGISPIRQNASNTELTQIDDGSSLQVPLISREISIDMKESSNIAELKNMIAEFRLNRELSALNASDKSNEINIDSIIREIQNNKATETSPPPPAESPPPPTESPPPLAESPPAKIEKVERKKTVFFAPEITSPVKLKPGKWRKSLAAWRKSHAAVPSQKRASRRFVALFPIKTDPNIIKRYTEKFEESLCRCKFNGILFFKNLLCFKIQLNSPTHIQPQSIVTLSINFSFIFLKSL